ncbi:MAG: sulfite exporter TauE/SafE family protein [Bacteroidia bacterium]
MVALIYSSVGFGGGSGYLAILSFANKSVVEYRLIALVCNLVVVAGNTFWHFKNKTFQLKKLIPFVVASVPMSFLGGSIVLPETHFKLLLGFTLLFAGIVMLWQLNTTEINLKISTNPRFSAFVGGIIGFISGLVGIGGGIFLAPILFLTKWDNARKISAAASFFILVNSFSGLVGQITVNPSSVQINTIWPFVLAVFIGGQIGARLNFKQLKQEQIKAMTAMLVIFAGLRILYKFV